MISKETKKSGMCKTMHVNSVSEKICASEGIKVVTSIGKRKVCNAKLE